MGAADVPASPPPIRLVAGLGNPGARYAATRHNAGQLALEALAARLGAGRFAARYGGRFAEVRGPSGPLGLLVPTTYMNDSGESVGPAAGALRAAPEQVLVIHDEIDLPFGTVRGKIGGGHGGHNGVRSVMRGLGGGDFARLRLGVGKPPPEFRGDGADWVLTRFSEPREEVDALIARAVEMAELALAEGMQAAIDRFHASPPGAKAQSRRERRERAKAQTGAEVEAEEGEAAASEPAGDGAEARP
jgi:peptidyl-tRNA hydrolase, PTH1 family